MKKFLVLGTGNAQKDLIKRCKDDGYYVIATSNVAGYSAEKLADSFFQVDITDIEATKKLAEKEQIDYIYSIGSDVAMETIAKVSKDLNLPCFVDEWAAHVCNHKYLLRKLISDNGIAGSIPFQILENEDEEINIDFPVMMKPSDSQGQRGVRRVDSVKEVKEHFKETLSFSREKKVIVESYIEGNEVSVNVFVEDGKIVFYLVSDRLTWSEYPGGLIREHVIISRYKNDKVVSERIRNLCEKTIEVVGIKNGPCYLQIKIDREGYPYLIEITPRLDGCHLWRLIRYSTGVDLLQASLDMLEGKPYNQHREFKAEPYSLEFLCNKPGSIFYRNSYDIPEHEYLCWYYQDGDSVNRMNGYFEKCGYIIKKG